MVGYSIIATAGIFQLLSESQNKSYMLIFCLMGVFNLSMLVAPSFLVLKGRSALWSRAVMVVGTVCACALSLVVERKVIHLFGHYLWLLSFIVVTGALWFKNGTVPTNS